MADRKAVNRYYPPDFDPKKHKSINKYRNSHPLRERARKLSQGILVIRFEMPYNIWCEGCGKHVGMGVRYNAEKKKVGNYYTTPIYQFRMKCHLCDNYYVIETDPQNCDYKIIEGARRKNQKWDMADNEQVLTEDREVIKKRARDPMYKLEHGVEDGKKLKAVIPTLSQIEDMQDSWRDDYMQNKMLRNKFREEKKSLKITEEKDQALLAKSSLDIPLLAESEEDKKLASLMKYNVVESFDDKQKHKRQEIKNRPLFASSTLSVESVASSSHSPASNNGQRGLQDIQKRLGLNKLKTSIQGGFGGDFDSPINKRTTKSSSNLGLVVVKKKRKKSTNANVDACLSDSSGKGGSSGTGTSDKIQDLITRGSNSNQPDILHSLNSVSCDKYRTTISNKESNSNKTADALLNDNVQDQVSRINGSVSVAPVGSSEKMKSGSMQGHSLNSTVTGTRCANQQAIKRPLLLCDYTSSSDSD